MKKARAFAHAVEFVVYLQQVTKEGKLEKTIGGLRKAIRLMVRLNRWKSRALKRSGDLETHIVTRKLGVPFHSMTLAMHVGSKSCERERKALGGAESMVYNALYSL